MDSVIIEDLERNVGCYDKDCDKCGGYAELMKPHNGRELCFSCFMEDYGHECTQGQN